MNRRFALRATAFAAVAALVAACAPSSDQGDPIVVVAQNNGFNTLTAAIEAAGLTGTLNGNGPFTVFAPTDAAFANLPAGTVDNLLLPENRDQLVTVLTYHVVPGLARSQDLSGQFLDVTTVQGGKVRVDGRNGVTVNNANVTKADVFTSNGVIHVIDTVLLPK